MRTLVIGDIHSSLKALKQVIERAKIDFDKDLVIFLGDYVDGWSEAAQTVQYLIELQEKAKIKPIFLRGNHDKWCEDWLIMGEINQAWHENGGKETMKSYIETSLLVEDSHRKFFSNLLDYYIDEDNRAFVHGGFVSRQGVGYEVRASNYYWDRDLWNLALMLHNNDEKDSFTDSDYKSGARFLKHKEVYIGHTATVSWKCKPHYEEYKQKGQPKNGSIIVPMNRCNVWNIDTGAGWFGKLTALDIDTKEYYQSDLVQELYKDERGRV